jgi:hypothetical protein
VAATSPCPASCDTTAALRTDPSPKPVVTTISFLWPSPRALPPTRTHGMRTAPLLPHPHMLTIFPPLHPRTLPTICRHAISTTTSLHVVHVSFPNPTSSIAQHKPPTNIPLAAPQQAPQTASSPPHSEDTAAQPAPQAVADTSARSSCTSAAGTAACTGPRSGCRRGSRRRRGRACRCSPCARGRWNGEAANGRSMYVLGW